MVLPTDGQREGRLPQLVPRTEKLDVGGGQEKFESLGITLPDSYVAGSPIILVLDLALFGYVWDKHTCAFRSAPYLMRASATLVSPHPTAMCRGVCPSSLEGSVYLLGILQSAPLNALFIRKRDSLLN